MRHLVLSLLFGLAALVLPRASEAQNAWIQVEAYVGIDAAQEAVEEYAAILPDVHGLVLNGGWYGVAIGPLSPDQAQARLNELRSRRQIPGDAFIADDGYYVRQFFPAGASVLGGPPVAAAATQAASQTQPSPEPLPAEPALAEPVAPAPVVLAEPDLPEETVNEARRSEAQLSRDERAQLQIALQWFGFYRGAIDAAFGPGTRGGMAAWQESKGHEQTGILTTRQRAELLNDYDTILSSIGFASVVDETAGIQIDLPLAMVQFDRYDPPFAHYVEKDASGVRVLLISQTGDEATLLGLFDIMQTLRVVPLEGERERRRQSFVLTGRNDQITSYTFATLTNGHVKGFTLIWPAGEDARYDVVLNRMRDSFTPLTGSVLPETVGEGRLDQSLDLLAGLEIRRPERSRSGVYIDGRGTVLTAAEAVEGCDTVTIDGAYSARVVATDPGLGLAILQPDTPLAPLDYARFTATVPRLQSEVAVAGYAFDGALSAPTLTFGTLADLRGLAGQDTLKRLTLTAQPGDRGGPVLDSAGGVLGVLVPAPRDGGRVLPDEVSFAADALAIGEFLGANGYSPAASTADATLSAESLTKLAARMTVLISCWN